MSPYVSAWQATRERIANAARAAGRDPAGVALVAVAKTFPAEAVRAVAALGQHAFGENYVQEAARKRDALADLAIEWRLVGPLQSNKARLAAEVFDAVETVDRLSIAERLSAARPASRPALDVLVQVNASGEATKSGVVPSDAVALARAVAVLPRIRLRGIMGIPEPTPDVRRQRAQFAALRACFESLRDAGLRVDMLSMGMSADLEAAIAEGATEVRIGTAIFGARASTHSPAGGGVAAMSQ
jgi:pyridoxal phosphate enzyme (YggS family)